MTTSPSAPTPFPFAREEFAGKTALITGGSDGLGRDLAHTLAACGTDVFFCARNRQRGEQAATEMGPHAHFIQADLAEVDQCRALVQQVGAAAGRLDFLVNNAAIDPRIEFTAITPADIDRLLSINLRPFLLVTQAALPLLQAGTGKAIVNVCTTNYMLGLSPFTLYNASKSAIVGFTRSLARELGPLGIRANTLSPGWIMTDKQLREHVSEQDKSDLLRAQSLKFLLESRHVTPATLFLLSSAACAITGQNLVVDGGKVMY